MDTTKDYERWENYGSEDGYVNNINSDELICKEDEKTGAQRVSLYKLAYHIPLKGLAYFIDYYLNLGGKQYPEGYKLGLLFRSTHRTLQRQVIAWCLGIICGLSRQEHTDARNEYAIEYAKKVYDDMYNGDINIGAYI